MATIFSGMPLMLGTVGTGGAGRGWRGTWPPGPARHAAPRPLPAARYPLHPPAAPPRCRWQSRQRAGCGRVCPPGARHGPLRTPPAWRARYLLALRARAETTRRLAGHVGASVLHPCPHSTTDGIRLDTTICVSSPTANADYRLNHPPHPSATRTARVTPTRPGTRSAVVRPPVSDLSSAAGQIG